MGVYSATFYAPAGFRWRFYVLDVSKYLVEQSLPNLHQTCSEVEKCTYEAIEISGLFAIGT